MWDEMGRWITHARRYPPPFRFLTFLATFPARVSPVYLEQPNPYKVLIIPREHVATLYDLTDEQAAQIFQVTVRIARLIRAVSGCEGLNVVQSNGTVGQQDVFHVHVHLVPRIAGDTQQGRIVLDWDNTPRERRELDRLAADLRLQLQSQSE